MECNGFSTDGRSYQSTFSSSHSNLPKDLREKLNQFCKPSVLEIADEQLSKDGTIKRVYKCFDGQLIESVLMVGLA
jgi:adenine C2-methylase RlmN of 23S rRNA A2503 and tRNA A37